ncbi:cytochrome P450 [Ganoderma sinense ZZ0214-1]|uniref:Cytochrome P450 n=1 Tax=Ganoderma sinense ZZ0214-1 TaxID=1077348 RepID=A0A2G8SL88_9APHY|nr:cytochrome P450 [Ganoderma sinense ZZ0214-1]
MVERLLLAASGGVGIILYALWCTVGHYLKRSPLDNLPGPAPAFLISGQDGQLPPRQSENFWNNLARTYGPVSRFYGQFGRRMLVIHDPKALYTVLVEDQEFFTKNFAPSNEMMVLLGPGLASTGGTQHKKQRKLLNPVFSLSHLRDLSRIFYDVANKAQKAIGSRISADGAAGIMDVNGWMARTTLEILGQAGLGYSFDDFVEDETDEYGKSVKLFLVAFSSVPLFSPIVAGLSHYMSDTHMRRFLSIFPSKELRGLIQISGTIWRRSREIVEEKKDALHKGGDAMLQEVGEGKDIMSICLKANMAASDKEKLSEEELIAQMSTFIVAGMDTTSNALSRILHLLAQNPAVQNKLRAELVEARGVSDGEADIPYDDLMKLPYLDAVCRETLRVFAPVALSARTAAKDSVVPLTSSVRGRDGKNVHEVIVPRGTIVIVHYQASNTNPAVWGEDADEWKPERWLAPLPGSVEEARIPGMYSNLMTFAAGSRSCIGFKFSELEMKVVLAVLLPKFSFELTDKQITWNSSAITFPTMGEESSKPEMLLKVAAL